MGAECAGRVTAKATCVTVDTACPATPEPHTPSTAARLLTKGVLSTSSSSWCLGWLQESCAACQRPRRWSCCCRRRNWRHICFGCFVQNKLEQLVLFCREASAPDAWSHLVLPVPQPDPRTGTGQSCRASVPLCSTKRCSTTTYMMLQWNSSRFATIGHFLLQFTSPLPHFMFPMLPRFC